MVNQVHQTEVTVSVTNYPITVGAGVQWFSRIKQHLELLLIPEMETIQFFQQLQLQVAVEVVKEHLQLHHNGIVGGAAGWIRWGWYIFWTNR